MTKKILAIYYTQSGQMADIIKTLTAPLTEAGESVEIATIKPVEDYNFPWTGQRFFSVMPSCVLGIPVEIASLDLKEIKYDLIILGYQPWFLSPSLPSSSLLQSNEFKAILKDTPVVTISAARNMWINAFVRVKKMLKDAGANHVGNIALVDRHPNVVSFITIFYWMLSGKKERYLNIFPKPGVDEKDINNTAAYGATVAKYLDSGNLSDLQNELIKQKAVEINYTLMFTEARAKPIFAVWAKLFRNAKTKCRGLALLNIICLLRYF